MRILFTSIIICGLSFTGFSQSSDLKPDGGDWNLEVNMNPFGDQPISISYIRMRYFQASNSAFRLGMSINGQSEKPDDDIKANSSTINLRPGFEIHFEGTNRLSPYVGVEFDFARKNSKVINEATNIELKGAWNPSGLERGYTRIGLNVVSGLDVYIIKNLYVGTEIAFGFQSTKEANLEFSPDDSANVDGGSQSQFGPNYNSSIRVGYIF